MIVSAKPPLALKKRQLSTRQLLQPKIVTGVAGEQQAITFLLLHNFKILDQNVRFGNYELDVVVLDVQNDEVVFVEVKSRSSPAYGNPAAAVHYRKLKALRKAAGQYLQACQLEKCFRFDIITVLPNKIEHFENITW